MLVNFMPCVGFFLPQLKGKKKKKCLQVKSQDSVIDIVSLDKAL